MKNQLMKLKGMAAVLAGLFSALSLCAQSTNTLYFFTSPPTPGANDIYNFIGSPTVAGNVGNGAQSGYTYVAYNNLSQGQTFTTGSTGGKVTAIWVRHCGYSADSGGTTYWDFGAGSPITTRITAPAQAGTAGFALDSETYTITGTEVNNPGPFSYSATGTGLWLRLSLTNGPTLAPNTQYGFDVTFLSTGGDFFETWGTNANIYSGGTAYNGSTDGTPDDTMNLLTGERAFLVEINGSVSPPAGATSAATINFQPFAPTPTNNDQYNFTGSPDEDSQVNNGVIVGDPNNEGDQFTYVADGQPNQGQFFTTPSANSGGYHVAAIWLRHVGYTSNTGEGNGTFWDFSAGGDPTFTFRLTDPSEVGTTNFALDTETVTLTGLETNNPDPNGGVQSSADGTGTWIRFGFSSAGTNITLLPNKMYGFDVMGSDGDFFSTLGTSNKVYSGGEAYNGTANSGTPDDTTNLLVGDRVFLVEWVGDGWTLQVAPPVIASQPATAWVPQGANAVFAPVVNGSPTLTYQWYYDTNTLLVDQTNATLTIAAVNTNNGTIGGYSVVINNNYGSVTSSVASLSVILPSATTNINFSAAGTGSILDENGNATPFNVRLPGTGSAIPTDDPNLFYDSANGVLNITSATFDFNGQSGMDQAEAIGMNLAGIGFTGGQDFTVTGYFTNFNATADFDQIGIFAGASSTNLLRGGEIYDDAGPIAEPGSFGVGTPGVDDVGIATAAAPTGEMAVLIGRAAGVWGISVNGVNVDPNTSLAYLNGPTSGTTNLIVGVFAENNGLDSPTSQVNDFTASLFVPKLKIAQGGGHLTFTWNVVGAGLESNTNLSNPSGWTPVAGASASPYVIPITGTGARFYRIAQ
jgi:hypothetical protein